MKRKTALILALASALIVALAAIIADGEVRERLGSSYYILALAIIGCVLMVLSGYVWDRTLLRTVKSLRESADLAQPRDEDDSETDEIIGLARKIERMAQTLQRAEASYRGIVEDQVDLICRYRTDGKLTFVNSSYARAFGARRGELIGQPFPYFSAGAAIGDEPYTFESERVFEGGRQAQIQWTQRAIKDAGTATLEYQAVGHDITERREAEAALLQAKEEAEAAGRAKSEFLALVSHELRTPIQDIIDLSNVLTGSDLSADQRDQIEMILESGLDLKKIIADILDLSKIDAGKIDIGHTPFSLADCVEGMRGLFAPKARAAGLSMEARVDPGIPNIINGDEPRVRQILANLLDNACKFTERGGIRLDVSGVRGEPIDPGSERRSLRLFFAVADTGVGIPTEKLGHLFVPFGQADPAAPRRRGGTGLGLIISKRLCECMGGTLSVESKRGEGSTFHFSVLVDFDRNKNPSRNPFVK